MYSKKSSVTAIAAVITLDKILIILDSKPKKSDTKELSGKIKNTTTTYVLCNLLILAKRMFGAFGSYTYFLSSKYTQEIYLKLLSL